MRIQRLIPRYMVNRIGRRGRVIAQTGSWSVVAKACGAANLFLSIPLVLHALGPAQFGAWATLASFVGLVGFLDFGFGNGTMNLVAAAQGRKAPYEIVTILNEGMRALLRVAGCVSIAAVFLTFVIPWYRLLGLPPTQADMSRAAGSVVLATIVCAIPLNLAARAQLGLGRGDRAFQWQALGQLLTLGAVMLCAHARAGLPTLTAVAIATPLISSIANTIDLCRSLLVGGTPIARDREVASRIGREGMLFFVLQLVGALTFASDLPLIAALRGPEEAGIYAIVQRLFSIIPLGLSLVWVPLWPTYRQALAIGDHEWVVRTLRSTLILAVFAALFCGLILAVGFQSIVHLWLNRPIVASGWLLVGFVAWYVTDAAGSGIAAFLNAASIVKFQVSVAVAFAVACLSLKLWGISTFGADCVPWLTTSTYLITVLLPTLILAPKLLTEALKKNY